MTNDGSIITPAAVVAALGALLGLLGGVASLVTAIKGWQQEERGKTGETRTSGPCCKRPF